jgi:hypothetical protein
VARYLLHADDVAMARWQGAAALAGVSFAEWLRLAAEERWERTSGAHDRELVREAVEVARPKKKGAARTTMCEHRVPPGSFCKRCD